MFREHTKNEEPLSTLTCKAGEKLRQEVTPRQEGAGETKARRYSEKDNAAIAGRMKAVEAQVGFPQGDSGARGENSVR